MYASGQGRWLSPDPLRACPLHPQKFDRYAYVGNSPTNRTDPRGDAVYPGFDYPYIDYGYGYYPPGYGYDEFDYLINFGVIPDYPPYGYPPYYGGLGFIAPFPTASKIACAFCVAACQGAYAGALSVCFAGALTSATLSSPVVAAARYSQCKEAAAQAYSGCLSGCYAENGPCNGNSPALPF